MNNDKKVALTFEQAEQLHELGFAVIYHNGQIFIEKEV